MNYLAHIYLSGNDEDVLIGNFIGDAVKGNDFNHYSPGIQAGIRLHRFIDQYTDSHDIVEQSKARLRPNFRKYAGVIVDMYYDHFLAVNWELHCETELTEFSHAIYSQLEGRITELPEKIQFMLPHMKRYNWLTSYASLEGIDRALSGMARRTSFESNMQHAVVALKDDYELFEKEFNDFFPELYRNSMEEIKRLNNP